MELPALLLANARDGFVDGMAQFVGGHGSEGFACLFDGLIEKAPLDGIFDEFRECAFLEALGTEMRAQGKIGVFRPDDC